MLLLVGFIGTNDAKSDFPAIFGFQHDMAPKKICCVLSGMLSTITS